MSKPFDAATKRELQQRLSPMVAHEPVEQRIELIVKQAYGPYIDSTNRLKVVLRLCIGQPPEVFWPVLTQTWSSCENTWTWQGILLDMMRSQATRPGVAVVPSSIWRGCSRARIRGISWTANREVAEGFARGHRRIRLADPVIVEARIDPRAVFVAIDGRNEEELLIDPRRLPRKMVIHKLR